MKTLNTRLAKWQADIARERRQLTAALDQGKPRDAAEHQRQIDQLTTLMQIHAEKYRDPRPAGGPVQTELRM